MAFAINIYKSEGTKSNQEETVGDFEIIRKEVGPTKSITENQFDWQDKESVIGDISKASKIRIGIKALKQGWPAHIFFADEKNGNSRGIIYRMDV